MRAIIAGLALLLMASFAHADYALSNSGTFGASMYTVSEGGSIIPSGGTLLGDELNLGWGSTDVSASGTSFSPYLMLCLGAGLETRDGNQYADVIAGIGSEIPATGACLVVGPAWRLFTGEKYPGLTASVNFQFGSPVWLKTSK